MALTDYTPVWGWFADSLELDIGAGTKSNQSGLSDPSIAGSGDKYADFDLTTGVMFTPASPLGANGQGDKTIVIKLQLDTSVAGRVIAENWDGDGTNDTATGWRITNATGTSRRVGLSAPPTPYTSEITDCPSNYHTLGQPFILAWRRSEGVWTVWGNADASGGMTELVPQNNSIGGAVNFTEMGDISLGAERSGANPFDGRIYWILEFNEAISDEDLASSAWADESNLKAAWLSTGVTGTGDHGVALNVASSGTGEVSEPSEQEVTGSGSFSIALDLALSSDSQVANRKLLLTQAAGCELRDENGAVVANLTGIAFEWYDKTTDTEGDPDVSGTFSTNASGEAIVPLFGTSLSASQEGILILEHPSDSEVRGVYRLAVH